MHGIFAKIDVRFLDLGFEQFLLCHIAKKKYVAEARVHAQEKLWEPRHNSTPLSWPGKIKRYPSFKIAKNSVTEDACS